MAFAYIQYTVEFLAFNLRSTALKTSVMLLRLLLIIMSFIMTSVYSGSVNAQARIALVIGNSNYVHAPKLVNPKNDAADMATAFEALGFHVIVGFDLDRSSMERTIRRFAAKLKDAQLGVFFFAGHGLQIGGVNYLTPTDAELKTADAIDFEMVRLQIVQSVMENATKTNVIFLDACRDNPLARDLARALGTRSTNIGRGLAPIEAGLGTFISYATQPGNVALDGSTRNSPYTAALKQLIGSPGEDLSAILIQVRNSVIKATAGKQVPWDQSALRARLFLHSQTSLQLTTTDSQRQKSVAQAWAAIHATDDVGDLKAFRNQYGGYDRLFDRLAKKRIIELEQRAKRIKKSLSKSTTNANPRSKNPRVGKTTIGRYISDDGCMRERDGRIVLGFRMSCDNKSE